MTRVSEKAEQAAIVELLETLGAKVYVLGTVRKHGDHPGTMQTPGLPDLLIYLRRVHRPEAAIWAQLLTVEVKARGGRLRPAQREYADLAEGAAVAHIVGGLDAVIEWLTDRGYLKAAKKGKR